MRARRRATAIVVALVLSSCSSDSTDRPAASTVPGSPASPASPIPVSDEVAEMGAPMGDGFDVPAGAVLLGRSIPKGYDYLYLGEPVLDRGWDAFLVVPGDPRPVVEDVVAQAEAAGFEVRAGAISSAAVPDGQLCGEVEGSYRCAALGVDRSEELVRTVEVVFHRRAASGGRPPESVLAISYSDSDRPLSHPADLFDRLPPIAGAGTPPPQVDASWPPLPEVGDEIGGGYPPDDLYRFTVVPGAEPVAHTFGDAEDYPGYTALFAVSGEALEVVEALAAQQGDDGVPFQDPVTTADGTLVTVAGGGGAGGSEYYLTLVEPAAGGPVLLLEVGYD